MLIMLHGALLFEAGVSSLLIDASRMNANLTKIYMEAAGCDVATCEDFGEAAKSLSDPTCEAECMFDLVVIDSRTIINHLKVLRAIRSKPDDRPRIISIIPEFRMGAVSQLLDAGSNLVLTYPYATQKFIDAIHRCLTTPEGWDSDGRDGCAGAHPVASRREESEAVASLGC